MRYSCLAACVAVSTPLSAQTVDLRRASDAAGVHEVAFCSRPSPNALGFLGQTHPVQGDRTHDRYFRLRASDRVQLFRGSDRRWQTGRGTLYFDAANVSHGASGQGRLRSRGSSGPANSDRARDTGVDRRFHRALFTGFKRLRHVRGAGRRVLGPDRAKSTQQKRN
jgi:hypothetical protein